MDGDDWLVSNNDKMSHTLHVNVAVLFSGSASQLSDTRIVANV
jgi:hypothetical protein